LKEAVEEIRDTPELSVKIAGNDRANNQLTTISRF
jgi:hypothetical protein